MVTVKIVMVKCTNVKNCKSQGEITFTEEEMLENIDDAGMVPV
jgi:hypothetical protein